MVGFPGTGSIEPPKTTPLATLTGPSAILSASASAKTAESAYAYAIVSRPDRRSRSPHRGAGPSTNQRKKRQSGRFLMP
jgi:hypothetical protein